MNIYDISDKAGVSIATVSRVLNEKGKVSRQTREKVLAVMAEYGYTPNAFARGLSLNTMRTIGLLCPNTSDSYIAEALFLLEKHLREEGYNVLLCCTGYELEEKQKYMKLLLANLVDAIILVGSSYVDPDDTQNDYIRSASKQVPIAIINAFLEGGEIYCTFCDDAGGSKQAVLKLLICGCQKVLYLYNTHSYSARQKLLGYQSAHQAFGISAPEELTAFCPHESNDISSVMQFLADHKSAASCDAILASDEQLAIAALKYLKAHNKRVPQDVQIIAFNNSFLSRCCDPELTCIDNLPEKLCSQCIASLTDVLKGKIVQQKTIFSAKLIQRGTTRILEI